MSKRIFAHWPEALYAIQKVLMERVHEKTDHNNRSSNQLFTIR